MFFEEADFSATPLDEFGGLINRFALENWLDPWFVAGVIMVESGGDPDAFNEASMATGLMQVMPREYGPPFQNRPTIEKLKDPATNLSWGCQILAHRWAKTHSEFGAVYLFSGGKYWKKRHGTGWFDIFLERYWNRYQNALAKLKGA